MAYETPLQNDALKQGYSACPSDISSEAQTGTQQLWSWWVPVLRNTDEWGITYQYKPGSKGLVITEISTLASLGEGLFQSKKQW